MKIVALLAVLLLPASVSPASPPPPLTQKQLYRIAAASSVRIRREGKEPGAGSGTVIASSPLGVDILTCAHVVHSEKTVMVDFDEEGKETVSRVGSVVKADAVIDLAVIHVGALTLPARPIASVEPDVFDEVYTVSAPQTIMRQASHDTLNTKDMWGGKAWTLSGEGIPGMSGAGLLNDRGELVCVLQAIWRNDDESFTQIVLAIPLKTVREFLAGVAK